MMKNINQSQLNLRDQQQEDNVKYPVMKKCDLYIIQYIV